MAVSMFLGAFFMAIIQHNKEKSDNDNRIERIRLALSHLNLDYIHPLDIRTNTVEMLLWKGHSQGIPQEVFDRLILNGFMTESDTAYNWTPISEEIYEEFTKKFPLI